jgi:hypothetical protein
MNDNKRDYWRGLVYFTVIVVCVSLVFTTPDGQPLFYGLLGLFRLSPGIAIGASGTLYIYPLVPIALVILSVAKILKYWQGYGVRFRAFNPLLRFFPVLIAGVALVFSGMFFSPTLVDRLYFAHVGRQSGLQAVTVYTGENQLRWALREDMQLSVQDFVIQNHGSDTVTFYVKLVPDHFGEAVVIADAAGAPQAFTLDPNQQTWRDGEFFMPNTTGIYGNGSGTFTVVWFNAESGHRVAPLVRRRMM